MRLIDADALDEVVLNLNTNRDFGITRVDYKLIDSVLFEFPTIEERKKGEWIIEPHEVKGMYIHRCGVCMNVLMIAPTSRPKYKYCPTCGADMRGAE